LKFPIIERIAGTTLKTTFLSPGATANPISSTLLSGSGTLVNSVTAVDSGGGHYYALHLLPTTPGWYTNVWWATIDARTYTDRQFVRARLPEVD
jgi:hypothetical protein